MSDCACHVEISEREQRRVLIPLLLINGLMFVVEMTFGLIGQSTGLIADSMDMLADATVYGIAMYAVGRELQAKVRAAHISGVFQVVLAFGVLLDAARRFIFGSSPESTLMVVMGLAALVANVICLMLIAKHRNGEIHMRASWVFSKNDVIANVGVIVGGAMVALFSSPLPDLIIGCAISIMVMMGGLSIIRGARETSDSIY
ncbi:MAG TPA: cation transporter [Mariprofundaceae bacterium]|nr:cation transporter [Mariprofundaceae bacterium]